MVEYGRVWYSMVEYGGVWYSMVQYGRVWWSMVDHFAHHICDSVSMATERPHHSSGVSVHHH